MSMRVLVKWHDGIEEERDVEGTVSRDQRSITLRRHLMSPPVVLVQAGRIVETGTPIFYEDTSSVVVKGAPFQTYGRMVPI